MIIRCANCKQIHYPRPIVDLEENTLLWGGKAIALKPRESEVMYVLLGLDGKYISTRDLGAAVLGITSEVNPGTMRLYLCRLRPRLAKMGIELIRGAHGWGLRWRVHGTATPPEATLTA